ncbi:unnamed protein product [Cuscuta campestris]|uniref:Uncharacterized protein n=1 Tax=Cuscuta campestris TaxID=132261 RepID=A0A484LI40_9ASTE|nr:unnamed protein product [Cuscuta campestris]
MEENIKHLSHVCVLLVGQMLIVPHDPNSIAGARNGVGESKFQLKFGQFIWGGFGFNDGEDDDFVFSDQDGIKGVAVVGGVGRSWILLVEDSDCIVLRRLGIFRPGFWPSSKGFDDMRWSPKALSSGVKLNRVPKNVTNSVQGVRLGLPKKKEPAKALENLEASRVTSSSEKETQGRPLSRSTAAGDETFLEGRCLESAAGVVDGEAAVGRPFVPSSGSLAGLTSEDKRKLSMNAKAINILHCSLGPDEFARVNEDEEETPFLKSRVKNKTINLGIEEICECFDIVDNRDGFETYDRHGWGIKGDTLASCIDRLHNGVEHSGIVRPKREFLNVNQQILLKILKECLLPTGSNDSIVGMLECAIVYLLKVESLVRFPMMMMNHMWVHKGYGQLPYGMALTKVFRRAKIKLEKYKGRNYEYKKMDATSLRRSKIFQHFDGFHTEASYNRISVEKRNRWRCENNLSKFASSSSSNPRPSVEVPPRTSSMPRSRSTHAKIDPSLKKYMDEKIAQMEESITKKRRIEPPIMLLLRKEILLRDEGSLPVVLSICGFWDNERMVE